MNTLLGTIITALVTDENNKFYFVQKDGVTFALSKEEGEHAIGDMVTGFAYTDSKQKSRLTQKEIKFRIKMGRNGISTIIIEFHKRSAVLCGSFCFLPFL